MKLMLDLQGSQSASRVRGIGRQARSLAKAIIERNSGHDISLLLNGMLPQIDELKADFASLLPSNRIWTFQAVGPVAQHTSANDWRMRVAELEREAFVARCAPDVLHLGSVFEGFLDDAVTSVGTFNTLYATAATLHDLIPLLNPEKYLANQSYRFYYLRKAQAFKRADLLLSVSESSRQEAIDVLQIAEEKIAVIYGGVDKIFRPLTLSPAQSDSILRRFNIPRKFILYVGGLDPRKNVEILLDAFTLLRPEDRRAYCVVLVGHVTLEDRRRLRSLGARYGLAADEFIFCDLVSEEDLIALYNICSLFVFPSRHEGFGLPALEAMACGAPLLAANRTSLPEIVGRADILFNPDDAGELAEKMTGILTNPERQGKLRSWGLAHAAGFTWDDCARRALDAFEALNARQNTNLRTAVALARRPKMAFLSPLPGDRTGIANYSAGLLPELARFYDIECIVFNTHVTDDWVRANYTLRDIGWFERNSGTYDRVLYSFGNSHFHAQMFDLLERFPGIVIMHDFYVSDLLHWMSHTDEFPKDSFMRELYLTHGLKGIKYYNDNGPVETIKNFACNGQVFRNATGVVVHSQYTASLAQDLFGMNINLSLAIIPHLRAEFKRLDRKAARARLGIKMDEFLVCSFGLVTPSKQNRDILEVWETLYLQDCDTASLIFVGGSGNDTYYNNLSKTIAERTGISGVSMTGYTSKEVYEDYLAAADIAVQLRRSSRGETSGAILDCFAAGLPVIINGHGPAADLPSEVVCRLPDAFTAAELAEKIEFFSRDKAAGEALGQRGRDYLRVNYHPSRVGSQFHDAIEGLSQRSLQAQQHAEISILANLHAQVSPTEVDLSHLANCISRNSPKLGLPQILCDVTILAEQDSKTGIQRVVRAVLTQLIENPPPGFRIEAVRIEGNHYRYARRFVERAFNIPAAVLADTEVDYGVGDIFLGIDWVPDRIPHVAKWLHEFRQNGGKVVFAVYDLLPLLKPEFFPDFMEAQENLWFEAALLSTNRFVCISRTVADDVARFGAAFGEALSNDVAIDYFHMGSDLEASQPSKGLASNAKFILLALERRKSFIMVGTIEPRKGHRQVLDSFDILWRSGVDVSLVIVGKRGWMVDEIALRIERNLEFGKRLFWLQDISDEMLAKVYASATALIAASAGEGFGLPLIEAARHGVRLIVRDLPVFHEVAGDYAFYFTGNQPQNLAEAIRTWLDLEQTGRVPLSAGMPSQSWKASVHELMHAMLTDEPYRRLSRQDGVSSPS